MVRELEKTLHIHGDDLPFINISPGQEARILMARPEERIYAIHLRAEPFCKSALHKHHTPVMGYTLKGAWGHDDRLLYTPGTFIFETPTVVHRFINGPDWTEAVFIGDPNLDFVDPKTLEVTGHFDGVDMIASYIKTCEGRGIAPTYLT
jgi:quercetin dioxygenase-like cupin family protein